MGRPRTGFGYLDTVLEPPGSVIAMAHRGGAAHPDLVGLENTAYAFRHAVALGYTYLETDVHLTAGNRLIAFHDDVLDRVTDGTGTVAGATEDALVAARIAQVHPIPTMAELLEEFAGCSFNIDLKGAGAGAALADLLDATGAHDRVCVGSFSTARIREFRRRTAGRVATSAAPAEVVAFLSAPSGSGAKRLLRGRVPVLQVPVRRGRIPIVTRRSVTKAHAAGMHVHVWTVDDPAEMERLIDLGVDGLITDRTDLLKGLLVSRGLWRENR